ncbi:MAG: hypothetical protein KGR16_00005 [Verrucomicrobia bacterium]|nr:hypothetical protein [Verrucomicrobiota bacterium]MDE3048091.1 hypothetical protein [Verrucomicrobiota bacterium]
MKLNIRLLVCGLAVICLLAWLVCERNHYNIVAHTELLAIREKLKALSPQEKRDLAFFIDDVIFFDQYPYTLVGYKPMSICNVIVEDSEDLLAALRETFKKPRQQMLMRGYLAWKKYQSLFPSKTHVMIDYSLMGRGRRELAIICPQLCRLKIQEHLSDFQEILGKPCTSEEVFQILTHPEHADFYRIVDHTRLVGILLGFGRNNAFLYEQHRGGPSRSAAWHSRRSRQDSMQMFSNEWPRPGTLLGPDFACDPTTDETLQLKTHYNKARKIVRWSYFCRNNLEVTLALLER